MDVRHIVLGFAGAAGVGDRITLCHLHAPPDAERTEVREGGFVLCGDDRHREAVRRYLTGERDLARDGSENRSGVAARDVDPAMLASGVLVAADREAPKDGTICGPRPCPG